MPEHQGLPILPFESTKAWIAWLRHHHARSSGLWVEIAKKGSGLVSIDYEGVREGALMYGWIDGQKGRLDEQRFMIRVTPRRARSKWSRINREIAEQLIAAKKMRKAGLAQVEAARADGRWDAAYEPPSTMKPHPALVAALDASARAREAFASISATNRYAILHQVQDAKREETRARRIAKLVAMLERGEVLYPGR